jgi:hypothetical protein
MYSSIEKTLEKPLKIVASYKKARSVKERLSAKMAKTQGFGVKARKHTN